jgi:hypothetical protein
LVFISCNKYNILHLLQDQYYNNKLHVLLTFNNEINMTESESTVVGGINGGTFSLNGGVTVNGNISSSSGTMITYAAASPSVSNINGSLSRVGGLCLNHSGSGTLNVTGAVSSSSGTCVSMTGTGILSINTNNTDVLGNASTTTSLGTIVLSSTGTLNLTAKILYNISGGSASAAPALYVVGTGTVNYVGNIISAHSVNVGQSTNPVLIVSACSFNVTGIIQAASGTASGNNVAVLCTANATINITGSVIGFSGSQAGSYAALSLSNGSLLVTGTVTGGGGSGTQNGAAIVNTGGMTTTINGNVIGGNLSAGIYSTSGNIVVNGTVSASNGSPAIVTTTTPVLTSVRKLNQQC